MSMTWKHDDLAADLAGWLRRRRQVLAFLNVAPGRADGAPVPPDHPGYDNDKSHDENMVEWEKHWGWYKEHPQGRADVLTLPPTGTKKNLLPHAFEVKVTRSDFWADVNKGKFERYHEMAAQVSFAVPEGLIMPSELPAGVGLIVRGEHEWKVSKGAPKNEDITLSFSQAWSLTMACHSQLADDYRRKGAAV